MEQLLLTLETRPEESRTGFFAVPSGAHHQGQRFLLEFNALARFLHNVEDLFGSLPQ